MLIILIGIIILLNFLCLDIITFYILFEATLLPLFILIGIYGSKFKEKAAYYILIYTLFSSLFMLLSIGIYIYILGNIDYININNIILSIDLQSILFIGLILGIIVKTPLFPIHT
jgi:NADH:ubiquinone oxidoreductase subunit 4 (subunit M)